jgi:hypothetical protein
LFVISREERIRAVFREERDFLKMPLLANAIQPAEYNCDVVTMADDEGLSEQFARVLSGDLISLTEPNGVPIPKDFSMQFDNLLGSVKTQTALYHQRLKQRAATSKAHGLQITASSGKKEQGSKNTLKRSRSTNPGFDPVEMLKKRALHLGKGTDAHSISTLTNDIHPLFSADNFHSCPQAVYDTIKPALQLASLMLTHKACSTYWHTLWFGERIPCQETSNRLGKPCFRIQKDVPWSPMNAHIFSEVLNLYASRIDIYFHTKPPYHNPCFAAMNSVIDDKDPLPMYSRSYSAPSAISLPQHSSHMPVSSSTRSKTSRGSVSPHKHHILNGDLPRINRAKLCLHIDFFTVARRLSKLAHPDPAQVLRYHFWLASTLCHEFAHYLEIERRAGIQGHGLEAFWYDDEWNEAGEAWEKKMWGGRVEPINSKTDCSYGLATVDWPLKKWDCANEQASTPGASNPKNTTYAQNVGQRKPLGIEDVENIYYTIPMPFVSRLQQASYWDALAQQLSSPLSQPDPKEFNIPRSGTPSIAMLAVDLTVWDDEATANLIADEDEDDGEESGNKSGRKKGKPTLLKRTADGRIVKRSNEKVRIGGLGAKFRAKKAKGKNSKGGKRRG